MCYVKITRLKRSIRREWLIINNIRVEMNISVFVTKLVNYVISC